MHGLPCSGKSTYVSKLVAVNNKLVVISYDDEVQEIAKKNGLEYNDLFRSLLGKELRKEASKSLEEKINKNIKKCEDIVFDLTNTSFFARKRALSYFENSKYFKEIHIMPFLDKQEFIERETIRYEELLKYGIEKSISVSVYDKFAKDYSVPTEKEGFNRIIEIK